MENLDINNDNGSELETGIELEDEMNQDELIYQIERASSQRWRDLIPMVVLCILSYAKS